MQHANEQRDHSREDLSPAGNDFAARLLRARMQRRLTQHEVAEAVETAPKTIGRWERGESWPVLYYQRKLCAFFGMSAAELGLDAEADEQPEPAAAPSPLPRPLRDRITGDAEPSQASAPLPPLPRLQSVPPVLARARRPARRARAGLLLLLLILGMLAVPGASVPMQGASSAPLGTLAFGSSGPPALLDTLTMRLAGLPAPATGDAYVAWMAGDTLGPETLWTRLGTLLWTHGTASLTYVAPQQNLLATSSHFLITVEPSGIPPQQPGTAWVAQASIPATPTPGDPGHYSLLDHLRHLLAVDPQLARLGMTGGLAFWLARDTQAVQSAATGAKTLWRAGNVAALRRSLITMLTVLDGSTAVGADLPPGVPAGAAPPDARVGLLALSPNQMPPGIVLHTDLHLEGVARALGATATQQRLAATLRAQMNPLALALATARQDILTLLRLSDAQRVSQAATPALTDLARQASAAASGARAIAQQTQNLAVVAWVRV